MRVLIGTTNPAKVTRFEEFLPDSGIEFLTLKDLGITAEPQESGESPEENARIKAAFYGKFCDRVICNDSGLYFDALALEDPRQPGLHIRTPQGKRLTDEEMIVYYSALVHSLGGKALAYYLDGFAVKTPKGVKQFMKSKADARMGAFWMLDTPVAERRPGWPLDSLSRKLDETSFLQEGVELKPTSDGETKKAWVRFLADALGLSPLEEA